VNIPASVKARLQEALWKEADKLQWEALGSVEKARQYKVWTDSSAIGGILSAYMDPRAVRVYIKDTLLKAYSRSKLSEHEDLVLRICEKLDIDVTQSYIKPHGIMFTDRSFVAWGRADDWKSVIGSLFERAYVNAGDPSIAILFRAVPRFTTDTSRAPVKAAATRLGVRRCVWFD
jgi:hypothetical protein